MTRPWKKHEPGALLTTTLAMLKSTRLTQLDIYEATGINPGWQTRFLAGKITDPGVNRIECLFDLLSNEHEGYEHRSLKQALERYAPLITKA